MDAPDTPATPAPMEGHGAYNTRSQVQGHGLAPAVALFRTAATLVPLPHGPITLADFGCSQGGNSLTPMREAIAVLRERAGATRDIAVIHTDLPDNDFSTLFRLLATDPASYMRDDPDVFCAAIGRSFYQQVLPADSLALGWSSWAVQWLSRTPAPIPDQLQVAFSRDLAARTAYAAQAAADWRVFLTHRGRELRPGGRLVVVTMALDDLGRFGYEPVMRAMQAALDGLVAGGLVTADEAHRMAIPTVGRSPDDIMAPFKAEGSFVGLVVEQLVPFAGEDTLWATFQADGDAEAFGRGWAAFCRASVFPTLAGALNGGAADPRRAVFFDAMDDAMARRLAAAPTPVLIPLVMMTLAKRA
ncbi:hypothetical protein ACQW02_18995 [Humitalea sp. 24SJ18S-53]|uniref:hypothetical protein n=1 Tax=Humitalea sp. 24SJ18S-53 TaxID=3422307 RepID=UPI003D667FF3